MNETSRTKRGWRIARRVLISLAVFTTLVALFYAEEDWRGKRAWENCKRELEARGVVLDWNAYIPPPVPDNQNFFKAPKMSEWFIGRGKSELAKRLMSTNANLTTSVGAATDLIVTVDAARNYLAWSDQFEPDFHLIREALKRPYARIGGDYKPFVSLLIPNFLAMRSVAQTLAQRGHCYLLLDQPAEALSELTLLHGLCRLGEGAPTGKPITLVAAMFNVAITGLYTEEIAEGMRLHTWQKPQLTALQAQLKQINLIQFVADAVESEQAASTHTYETVPASTMADLFSAKQKKQIYLFLKIAPRGWIYQNMANSAKLLEKQIDAVDTTNGLLSPDILNDTMDQFQAASKHFSPYTFIATLGMANFVRVWQTTAHRQTMVNEAQTACALGQYRLAHGEYPGTLDALVPQFIEKLPHDIIGGRVLHYRRTTDGKFLLYSVGWNEKDDDGMPGTLSNPEQGDWVWEYPAK